MVIVLAAACKEEARVGRVAGKRIWICGLRVERWEVGAWLDLLVGGKNLNF
jgi:hypothetical protein